jgi:hypothetical protein
VIENSPSTSSGGSVPSRFSAVCSHFARTGSNIAVAAAAGANLSSTSGNSCLPTCAHGPNGVVGAVSSYEVRHHTSPALSFRTRAATALFHGTHSQIQSSLLLSRGLSCKTTFSKEL